MNYVIDLSSASDRHEIHAIIARTLRLPDHYGRNLDALWDCLTSDLSFPCMIHLTVDGNVPYLRAVCDLFERAHAWHTRRGHEIELHIHGI